MPTKLSAALLGVIIMAGIAIGAYKVLDVVTSEHDGWDIFAPVEVGAPPLTVEPVNLLLKEDRETIERVVMAGRTDWGLPVAIVVVDDGMIEPGQSIEDAAAERATTEPVESSEDAGDGLLMLVVVPDDDHTATEVAFVPGPNFYPRGGITPERLAFIADVQMQALVDENRIGPAVIEGATWVLWTHLFEPTPDPPASNLERGLDKLLVPLGAAGIAALALAVALAAATVTFMTWRGAGSGSQSGELDGIHAAAAERGRVDRGVLAGAVLDAIDRGTLAIDGTGALHVVTEATSARDRALAAVIAGITQRGGSPTAAAIARRLTGDGSLEREIEVELAGSGRFHPRSSVLTAVMRWIAITGTVLGMVAIVISVMGEAPPALLASIALAAISLVALIWNEQRSWTTRAGRAALKSWRDRHEATDDRERALFDAIVDAESLDIVPPDRSPLRPEARGLAAHLTA
jgi:hypothetical protein